MNTWWSYWVLGRRYASIADVLHVRLWWGGHWHRVRFRKVMGPLEMTDEVKRSMDRAFEAADEAFQAVDDFFDRMKW